MNVEELRSSEYIDKVESAKRFEWSSEEWKVTANEGLSNTQEGIKLLCTLNIVWEDDDGTFYLRKGEITKRE